MEKGDCHAAQVDELGVCVAEGSHQQPRGSPRGQLVWTELGESGNALDGWHSYLVRTDMNRVMETLFSGLGDEVSASLDTWLGTDTEEWKEVNVLDIARKIMTQANGRVTVGYPLCKFRLTFTTYHGYRTNHKCTHDHPIIH